MNPWAEEAQDRTFEKLREETSGFSVDEERVRIDAEARASVARPAASRERPKHCSMMREELIDVCVTYDVSAKVMKAILNAAGFDI